MLGKPTYEELEQRIEELEEDITELTRFKVITDQAAYGAAIADIEGTLTYVNDAFAEMHGYATDELIGAHLSVLHSEEQMERVAELLKRLMGGGSVIGAENMHQHKDGAVFPTLMTATVISDESGEPMVLAATAIDITERKQAEDLLKRSSIIVESTSDAVITTDVTGIITSWNKGAEKIYGYQQEEAVGKHISMLYEESNLGVLEQMISDLTADKETPIMEVTCVGRGHKSVVVLLSLAAIKNTDGDIVELAGIAVDVTEWKQAEEALNRTQELYRLALDASRIKVWESDIATGKTLYSLGRVHTGPDLDAMPRDLSEYLSALSDEERQRMPSLVADSLSKDGKFAAEFSVMLSDGNLQWFENRGQLITDESGNPVRAIGTTHDITQRKQTELEVKESEERYRTLFETVNDAVMMFDGKTRKFLIANDAAIDMYGYSRKELLELRQPDITAEPEATEEAIQQLLAGERIRVPLRYHKKKDGTVFPVEVSSGSFGPNNRMMVFGIIKDITERQRKDDLVKNSLREKNMLLKEVHHRVKNNLQIMSSLLALSKRSHMSQQAHDQLREARNRINSMALIHTQLYEGENLNSINIAKHLQQLSTLLIQTYTDTTQRIEISTQSSEVCLSLSQAIPLCLSANELLSNACRHAFTRSDGGKIIISIEAGENDTIILIIRDNGSGIPADIIENHEETMGLNLAMNLIKDQLKGDISFDVADGTRVTIRFRGDGLQDLSY